MKNTVLIMNNELEQAYFNAFLIKFCGCYNEISIVVRLQAVHSRDSIPKVKMNLSVSHPVLNGTLVQPASIPNDTGGKWPPGLIRLNERSDFFPP